MKSDKFEWQLVFERAVLRKSEWDRQPRDSRIDPLHPDDRYGAVVEVQLLDKVTGEIVRRALVPTGATPVCWARRRAAVDGPVIDWVHFTGWQFGEIRYVEPVSDAGVIGHPFLEPAR